MLTCQDLVPCSVYVCCANVGLQPIFGQCLFCLMR